jgi:hypothetical protein
MICPRCGASIKYKERSNNTCSSCKKEFAFEPKTHPLLLTDKYFSKVVDKLSGNGKLYYTPQQLMYAVSRKKMKSSSMMIIIVILAIVTSIIAGAVFFPLLIFVVPFWILVILAQIFYFGKFVAPPQSLEKFEASVINRWRSIYGISPEKLIIEKPRQTFASLNLRGILFCQTEEMANFIIANQLNIKFGLSVVSDLNSHLPDKLPIFILHDASSEGVGLFERVKAHFGNQRKVFDLGLRPSWAMRSNILKFREHNYADSNFSSLTSAEKSWLKKGHYAPLFALRPDQLIKYLTKRFEKSAKKTTVANPEKAAQSIGFMTWAGEK